MSVIYIPPSKNVGESVHDINSNFDSLDKGKADKSSVYTKTETDGMLSGKADKSAVYTKNETDSKLSSKVDKISGMGLSQESYTTAEKNKLAELSNYDDTAVKADIAALKSGKANKSDVYTKSETDYKLSDKADKSIVTDLQNEFSIAVDRLDEHDSDISGLQAQTAYMSEHKLDNVTFNGYKSDVRGEFSEVTGRLDGHDNDIADLKSRRINGVLFDGSGDIKIGLDSWGVYDGSTAWSEAPWHKIASCEMTSRVQSRTLTLYVEKTLNPRPGNSGILRAFIRSGDKAGSLGFVYLDWEYANGLIDTNNFVLVYNSDETTGKLTAELWMKITTRYEAWQFKVLSMGETTTANTSAWTLSDLKAANYSEGTGVITSSLMGIKNNADTASTVSAIQKSLYSTTSGGNIASPLSVTVSGLFTAYSLIICNMTTSAGQISCMLPMKYIKSLNGNYYTVSNSAIFQKVENNTMRIHTGLGQSNPTISKVELIAVY